MRLLEEELGVDILVRSGNRIVGMTEAGTAIVQAGRRALVEARQIEEIAREATHQNRGQFTVATTHLHVRYSLLPVIKTFAQKYPNVQLKLLQGAPAEIATRVSSGEADVGISTGTDDLTRQCVSLDAYPLYRCVIAPRRHPLLRRKRPTLRDLAAYPLIIYDPSFSSGSVVTGTFEAAGITPNVVLSAMDADVIKAYVGAGVGIAVLQKLAFDPARDLDIGALGVDHLFPPSTAKLILSPAKYLRRYMFDFIEMVAPTWTPKKVREALVAR